MMNDLLLHPSTQSNIAAFLQKPSHNLLIVGNTGSGKSTVAFMLIASILGIHDDRLLQYPHFLIIEPEKNSISIESIRRLHEFVRLKTTGSKAIRRAILIKNAHRLTAEAQNAFLKLLEEPPKDTIIVMTAQGRDSLLPTILSRVPKIIIRTPAQDAITQYFTEQGYDPVAITKAYYMSRGQIGLLFRLLQERAQDETVEYIRKAKQFLQATQFDRLVMVDQFTKQKVDTTQLIWALQRVADTALHQAAQKNAAQQIKHWKKTLHAIIAAQDNLSANPQAKLLLTNLSLQC